MGLFSGGGLGGVVGGLTGGFLAGGPVGALLGGGAGALLGGGAGNLFGSQQGTVPYNTNQQTSQQSSPWSPMQPYLQDLFSRGQAQSNMGPSPYTTEAQNMMAQLGRSPFSPTGGQVLSDTLAGNYLNPSSNPYFAASVNDALGLAKSQFAGQYGGAAGSNLSNSGYQEGLARTLGNVATNAYANNYAQERQNQMGALGMAPNFDLTTQQILASRPALLSEAGAQQQAFPWQQLQGYQAALSPGLGFGQTTGSSIGHNEQPYYQNNTAQTLGGLLGGAGLGMGLYSMFSDRRLKTKVKKLGTHRKGFGIYKYSIFGKERIGVMAQELEKFIPRAVKIHPSGYRTVDYGMVLA